jgi:hypothetical protein
MIEIIKKGKFRKSEKEKIKKIIFWQNLKFS